MPSMQSDDEQLQRRLEQHALRVAGEIDHQLLLMLLRGQHARYGWRLAMTLDTTPEQLCTTFEVLAPGQAPADRKAVILRG